MKLEELLEKYKGYEVKEGFLDFLEKPKPKTIWDLENEDSYWYFDTFDGTLNIGCWDDFEVDRLRRKHGNCFLTKEEAEKELKRQEVEVLLKKYSNGYEWEPAGSNCCLGYNVGSGLTGLRCFSERFVKTVGIIYFPTRKAAEKAIAEIGEERIVKDYFQIGI